MSFTVSAADLAETRRGWRSRPREGHRCARGRLARPRPAAKVSIVGLGMRTHTGVATAMFEALAAEGVNIEMITTSEIKISVLVDRASAVPALRAVHRAFGLDEAPVESSVPSAGAPRPAALGAQRPRSRTGRERQRAPSGTARSGMEDLVISGVELDEGQSRITVLNVPDQPGYAAALFREIARADVFVDMIVQSAGSGENTHLSFTVPRAQAARAAEAAGRAGPNGVLVEAEIAKLSVLGVGGPHPHGAVATRMFKRPGRARHQHRADQHQRGPDQRRDRLRKGPRRPERTPPDLRPPRRPEGLNRSSASLASGYRPRPSIRLSS